MDMDHGSLVENHFSKIILWIFVQLENIVRYSSEIRASFFFFFFTGAKLGVTSEVPSLGLIWTRRVRTENWNIDINRNCAMMLQDPNVSLVSDSVTS